MSPISVLGDVFQMFLKIVLPETINVVVTIYIKGCLDLLKNESKVISATNYLDLSKSILDLALGLTTQGQLFVQKNLIENHHPTQAIKQCINEFYNQTINSLRSSLDELVKNPEGANKDAKLAGN
jgi:hypothetical protein